MLLATATKPVLICSVMVVEKKIPWVLFSSLKKDKELPKEKEFSPADSTPGLAKQNAISWVQPRPPWKHCSPTWPRDSFSNCRLEACSCMDYCHCSPCIFKSVIAVTQLCFNQKLPLIHIKDVGEVGEEGSTPWRIWWPHSIVSCRLGNWATLWFGMMTCECDLYDGEAQTTTM